MGSSTYEVVVIREGREADYHAFWERDEVVNAKGEELHPALLSLVEIIQARNLEEAIDIAQMKHPSCTIHRRASTKTG